MTKYKRVKKIEQALANTSQAVENVNDLIEYMSEYQRKLFLGLAKGYDNLHAVLYAGGLKYIRGIARIVYLKEMKRNGTGNVSFEVDGLTFDNVDLLEPASYDRLQRIATANVNHYISEFKPDEYKKNVGQLIQMISPEALAVATEIMTSSKSDKVRLDAAQDLMDRAGLGVGEKEKGATVAPVLIQINLGGTPKSENNPLEVWKKKQ